MRSRFEAYMDDVALSSLHPMIYITNISHKPATLRTTTAGLANRSGNVLLKKERRDGAQVTISFMLRIYSTAERQKAVDQIVQWANGSILKTSDREFKQLHCVCTAPPFIGNALRWTDVLTVTFTAFSRPFWEDVEPTKTTLTGTSGSKSVFVPGNAGEALVEAKTSVSSGSLTAITFTTGSTSMAFSGGTLANSSNPMEITYDEQMIQSIKTGNTSLINYRSSASADDLIVICGKNNTFAFSGANVSASVEFSVRGLWL